MVSFIIDYPPAREAQMALLYQNKTSCRYSMKMLPDERKTRDVMTKNTVPVKKSEVIDGYTIKYHANGITRWSKGKIIDGKADGYWEWYRIDGSLKRSGYYSQGEPVGEWTTYDQNGNVYKVTSKKAPSHD